MDPSLEEYQAIALLDFLSARSWVATGEIINTLGMSIETLSFAVRHLASWGLQIRILDEEAYRLESPVQRLRVSRIRSYLPPAWRAKIGISVMLVVDSTNTRLLRDWPDQIPSAIFAEHQTDGRGRRARGWHSPFGVNLYLSVAWTFNRSSTELSTLPLAVGVCCVRALASLGVEGIAIKWPNDLWILDAKLGGILVECCRTNGVLRVVIGVGINVNMNQDQLRSEEIQWATLQKALAVQNKAVPDRNKIAATVLANIADGLKLFSGSGFGPFRDEWASLDLTRDRIVCVISGSENMKGIARGIDDKGALCVETSTGMIHVHSGDVSLRVVSK